jgi:kynurenine formamidase
MQQTGRLWEAHRVMREREYYHLENMANFDQLPRPFGFKVAVFPVKIRGASASPVRAVAILEDEDTPPE